MSLWAGPPVHRSGGVSPIHGTGSVHPWGQVRRAGDELAFPLGGSVSRNLRTEPAVIPARGRFPIPMETAALVDALPRPHRLDLRLYHSSHSPAFLPDSQIFISTDQPLLLLVSLLLVLLLGVTIATVQNPTLRVVALCP